MPILLPLEPPSLQTAATLPNRHIFIRHPHYAEPTNVLFKLYGCDKDTRCLDAMFVLVACGIVTGNRWDGYLSTTKNGGNRIDPASTPLLEDENYYFHLPDASGSDSNEPYVIVPNFHEWQFPHHNLPQSWTDALADPTGNLQPAEERTMTRSNIPTAINTRDVSCRVTGCQEGLEIAHLVHQREAAWWNQNSMSDYNSPLSTLEVDDATNCFLLRRDLHGSFDRPMFVFVPKKEQEQWSFVLHMMMPSHEYEKLYHNRRLQELRFRIEMLLARFAWSVFPLLNNFLRAGVLRRLAFKAANNDTAIPISGLPPPPNVKWVDGKHCTHVATTYAANSKSNRGGTDLAMSKESMALVSGKRSRSITFGEGDSISVDNPPSLNNTQEALDLEILSDSYSDHSIIPPFPSTPKVNHTASTELKAMISRFLQAERVRSDPNKEWTTKLEWKQQILNGGVLYAEDASKWVEVNGWEIEVETSME
jgi:phage pi2 protein 07